jgi:hypothetical protein
VRDRAVNGVRRDGVAAVVTGVDHKLSATIER